MSASPYRTVWVHQNRDWISRKTAWQNCQIPARITYRGTWSLWWDLVCWHPTSNQWWIPHRHVCHLSAHQSAVLSPAINRLPRSLLFLPYIPLLGTYFCNCLLWLFLHKILQTSKFSLSFILGVMVPCFSPFVFIIRIPSALNISLIWSGVAVVAKSKSFGWIFISRSLFRTANHNYVAPQIKNLPHPWLHKNFWPPYLTAPPAILSS